MAVASAASLAGNAHARRFVKFCIVGASSTIVLMAVEEMVVRLFHSAAPLIVHLGSTLGFILAVVNGFYWNRRWTFQQRGKGASAQFWRFLAINIVGLTLNNLLLNVFYDKLHLFHQFPKSYLFCQLLATFFVTAWNFYANSKWTFKTI